MDCADASVIECSLDATTGHLVLRADGSERELPALWLRERWMSEEEVDLESHQRLYDPTTLDPGLRVNAVEAAPDAVHIAFSDGSRLDFDPRALAVEAGLLPAIDRLPPPRAWRARELDPTPLSFARIEEEGQLLAALDRFFRDGFVVFCDTEPTPGALEGIARRFGPIRETHWGTFFDVKTKPQATDLAYTGRHLSAHTDNPYRRSVPGIQLLHCLANDATGGDSTLVDGIAIARRLADEDPEAYAVLAELPVSFRYDSSSTRARFTAPILGLDEDGELRHIRSSTRLDFVAPASPEKLEVFYRGRRRLARFAADPEHQLTFRLRPGDCVMMDNHRLLHGRTAFAPDGHRHLQGCYIDHDGPESLYRVKRREASRAARAGAAP